MGIQEIFSEVLAKFDSYLTKGAMPLYKIVKVLIDECPLIILLTCHLLEVSQEVRFLLGLVQETKLLIDEGLRSDTTDSLCLVEHVGIKLSFHLVLGMCIDVDAEIFSAAHLHRLWVANRWIEIQVE